MAVGSHDRFTTASQPPHANGIVWSIAQPGHAPLVRPVAGHGWARRNAESTSLRRLILPDASRAGAPQIRSSCSGSTGTAAAGAGAQDDKNAAPAAIRRRVFMGEILPRRPTADTRQFSMRQNRRPIGQPDRIEMTTMKNLAMLATMASLALQGCATAEASGLAARAMAGCHSTRLIELVGGKWWDSSSARIECGPPAPGRHELPAVAPH
jgi:hypothetical protein